MIRDMLGDLRVAFRRLRRQPAATVSVWLVIGVSLAGTTALFSVIDGVAYRPLPFPDADQLVHIEFPLELRRRLSSTQERQIDGRLEDTDQLARRAHVSRAFLFEEGAADVVTWNLRASSVSPSLFAMLGVHAIAGRTLVDSDAEGASTFATVGGAAVSVSDVPSAMIGYELWKTHFGADEAIVGGLIDLPGIVLGRRVRLIGVLPEGFSFPDGSNVWLPARTDARTNVGRLAAGVTIDSLRAAFPDLIVTSLSDRVRPEGTRALRVLLAATGLLLVVAFVHVAGLLLTRTAGRTSEIGARLALGAGRGGILRQFAAEGAILVAAGLALAWGLAPVLTTGIIELLPAEMTRGRLLAPDLRALGFASAMSAVCLLALCALPVDIVRRVSPASLLRGFTAGDVRASARRTQRTLLIVQLALTMALIHAGGLAVHAYRAAWAVDPGFSPDRIVAAALPPWTLPLSVSSDERDRVVDRQRLQTLETIEAVSNLAGVEAVATGPIPLLAGAATLLDTSVDLAVDTPAGELIVSAVRNTVTRDYVRVLGADIIAGRIPAASELVADSQAIVNETLARQLSQAGAAVGRDVRSGPGRLRIVAVVSDYHSERPDRPVQPRVLVLRPDPDQTMVVARIREDADIDAAALAIRRVLDRIWTDRSTRSIWLGDDVARTALTDHRARSTLLSLVATAGVVLAVAGLTGALCYSIQIRRKEIGIRAALGASPAQIRRDILRSSGYLVAAGIGLGLPAGFLTGRLMASYVDAIDGAVPLVFVSAAGVLLLVGCASALVAARAALAVAPASILRDP